MDEFLPLNDFKFQLLAAKRNEIFVVEFVKKLLSSDLAPPTAEEVQEDGSGFIPVFFDNDGSKMLAVFTDKVRVSQSNDVAKYSLVMNGLSVLRRIPNTTVATPI